MLLIALILAKAKLTVAKKNPYHLQRILIMLICTLVLATQVGIILCSLLLRNRATSLGSNFVVSPSGSGGRSLSSQREPRTPKTHTGPGVGIALFGSGVGGSVGGQEAGRPQPASPRQRMVYLLVSTPHINARADA